MTPLIPEGYTELHKVFAVYIESSGHSRQEAEKNLRRTLGAGTFPTWLQDVSDGTLIPITKNRWLQPDFKVSFVNSKAAVPWLPSESSKLERRNIFKHGINYFDFPGYRGRVLVRDTDAKILVSIPKRRRGRNKGDGAIDDSAILDEMTTLIDGGKATSPHNAALMVREKAKGSGSLDSKQSRLERKYRSMLETK